jgi:hypothetical protein
MDLGSLLARELTRDELPGASALMSTLRPVRARGYLTRNEFLACCRWKSPRSIRHCEKNPAQRIRRQSAAALASRDERVRFEALTTLDGVGAPTASAILTLIDPRRYGVLDIRVWQLLHALGAVTRKPGGVGFTCDDWCEYLKILRRHARALRAPVRAVEYSLFLCHERMHQGVLYGSRGIRIDAS